MSETPASPEVMESLWQALPVGRFTGNHSQISHRQVEFVVQLIDDSGVADQIDAWQLSDRKKTGAGGRPRLVSTRTALALLLLLSTEHSSLFVKEMAVIAGERLSNTSLRHLGLWGHQRDANAWFWPLWRALHRALDAIDPKPGHRREFPTPEEIELTLRHREETGASAKQARLNWVCNQLVEATLQLVPAEFRQNWEGDLCIDATVVPAFGKRGAPWGKKFHAVEHDAGWYTRDSRHNTPTDPRKVKKAVFGWDVTIAVQTNHDPNTLPGFPLLVAGIAMTVPGRALIEAAKDIVVGVAGRGHPIGRLTGDRGYAASAHPDDYQLPARRLGYKIYTDYREDQLGAKDGYAGAIQVEGALYCPSMPERLITATIDERAGRIDKKHWRQLIVERRQYMLRPKSKPDAKGSIAMMCPARGPGATANCPLVNGGCGPSDDARTPIFDPPEENKRDKVCTNATSVTVPIEAGAKLAQDIQYGSDEWSTMYNHDRNTIEGVNGFLKDGAHEGIHIAERRRMRGSTAQFLMIAMLVVTGNLRKLQNFRDEMTANTSVSRDDRDAAQLAARKKRRENNTRIAPWDNFAAKNKEEDRLAARKKDPPGKK
ncbi:hypothetical protein [Cryobacterium sp.]|jgi:hypothetical protein|uniref:hypothetical protein n=1 Tax=Cryobacterium sp. TaxID=1926290 RepID=UPI00260C5A19|nr:hypothetical protein [Cryobacterium sp.]MCU1447473.1 hypothetical protein [Cryobacterium sp.]